ncbi:MAG: ATP-binding cassette domain-containing protein [Gemmatimonadetes bacterium]|nr:ATP-binding cassette domain-containing protein [Gemmatimonadota bacterium]
MIELKNVYKRFGEHVVLDGVDFVVQPGETVALLGPSGVGKSVLLKHINGLIHPDAGEVFVEGMDVRLLKRRELSRLRSQVGYVFQYGALFDSENVFENIRLGITDDEAAKDRAFCERRVVECLGLVNLPPDTAEKYPAELSGGMRKRVGIARAIAGQPMYLLYDEPTSGLDPVNASIIDSLVEKLRDELGVTSVVVTHDVRSAFQIANRIALLHEGKIRAEGNPEQLLAVEDEAVQRFLGRDLDITLAQLKRYRTHGSSL